MIGKVFAKPLQPDTLTRWVENSGAAGGARGADSGGMAGGRGAVGGGRALLPEAYENPAPNTLGRYREAAQWADENGAVMLESGPTALFPQGFYEVCVRPEPSEEEKAAWNLRQAKAERARAVAGITVTVDGMVFDGDEAAQERMARAVLMAESPDERTAWVLADHSVAEVSASQLRRACRAAGQEQTRLWVRPYEGGV